MTGLAKGLAFHTCLYIRKWPTFLLQSEVSGRELIKRHAGKFVDGESCCLVGFRIQLVNPHHICIVLVFWFFAIDPIHCCPLFIRWLGCLGDGQKEEGPHCWYEIVFEALGRT